MSIQTVPQPLPQTIMVCGFNYYVDQFILNQEIRFTVVLVDQNGVGVSSSKVTLAGEDYTVWGNDDNYVIQFICNALGLTLANPPPVVPVDPEVPVDPVVPVNPMEFNYSFDPEVSVDSEASSA